MRARILIVAALLTATLLPAAARSVASEPQPPQPREGAAHAPPLHGDLVHIYDAPDNPFAAGHRGVDVAAEPGTPVRASAAGVVSFSGVVAGNRSVTVDHGDGIRTTYSFLASAAVAAGDEVQRGDVLGTVGDGHPNSGLPPHVHLSARRGDEYFDPLELYVGTSYADLIALVQ